ncbi:DNA-processing protein DprA [Poritiphilus sp. M415]|uniref:DNA-processing protein DprA n=2 Tax=Lentiprolixibacter aurantiacus TaxID=2993939 RepID=A0AAE3MJ81_9FLAO|nr:DNA-processing protein DprA [Lentiprolixibacter aurantiacus]MCX2718586.1 DNA-processing protein DprA [Lentiprolixibacter aurantiacus]
MELFSLLRLQAIPNIGDQTAKKLIEYCGSAEKVFRTKKVHLLKLQGLGSRILQELHTKQFGKAAERELRYIRDHGIGYIPYGRKDYPKYLRHCSDGPILLFARGTFDLKGKRMISVVGTRNSTSYGEAFCDSLVEDLAPLNPVIVSGFAYGIDISIHKACIRNDIPTLGVLAHGLNQIYPRNHIRYAGQLESNGGFLTEFWSSSKPNRENFLKRNRIIAGISEATVVVESASRGGALITADMAHGYNREVFAVPGRVDDTWSQGCNQLIKMQKASMLTSAADLIYMLGWDLPAPKPEPVQKQLFISLDAKEQIVYSFLTKNGKNHLDEIALGCGLSVSITAALLFSLEMKKCVRPLPGKLYEAV